MKAFIKEHFDRLLMLTVTMTFLACWLIFQFPELARLTELSFVGLTALVGGRRSAQTGNTGSGDVNILQPTDELKDLTTPEAIGAIEQIKEEKNI